MKGIVFTEFLDMVETHWSAGFADALLDATELKSGGAYTTVGTYDFGEMVALLGELSRRTGIAASELLYVFGQHFFARLTVLYPDFIVAAPDAFSLLAGIEDVIHTEVRKLYPDAELPAFEIACHTPERLELLYQSPRCLSRLAHGLIDGALQHYGEQVTVRLELLEPSGQRVRIVLERSA